MTGDPLFPNRDAELRREETRPSTGLRVPSQPKSGFHPVHLPDGVLPLLEPYAESLIQDYIRRFEILSFGDRIRERVLNVFALEGSGGGLRPGFLGSGRAKFEDTWNSWFGEKGWDTQHIIGELTLPRAAALTLYEKAYIQYFQENPGVLNWLTENYRDVYDNSPSNIESGKDYSKQEVARTKGVHLQDIAIRRAVAELGREFNTDSDKLLQIRGSQTAGYLLSPGLVPFKYDINFPPLEGWWKPGTIEEFYQSTRFCFVKGFNEANTQKSLWLTHSSDPSLVLERIAARFLIRTLPSLGKKEFSLREVAETPWALDRQSMVIDEKSGWLPREFRPEEGHELIKNSMSILAFMLRREQWLSSKLRGDLKASHNEQAKSLHESPLDLMAPLANTYEHLKGFRELHRKHSLGEPISATELGRYPEFSQIKGWTDYLHHFADKIDNHKGGVVFLARDALGVLEYMKYRNALTGTEGDYSVAYLPGSPVKDQGKSYRNPHPVLDELTQTVWNMFEEAKDEAAGKNQTVRDVYSEKIRDYLQSTASSESLELCRIVYQNTISGLHGWPEPLLIIDGDGTGKTAFFLKRLIEHFSSKDGNPVQADVFLGRCRDNVLNIECIKEDREGERKIEGIFPDLHWPFRFGGFDNEPRFNTAGSAYRYLSLLWRSIEFYNAAVRDLKNEGAIAS